MQNAHIPNTVRQKRSETIKSFSLMFYSRDLTPNLSIRPLTSDILLDCVKKPQFHKRLGVNSAPSLKPVRFCHFANSFK